MGLPVFIAGKGEALLLIHGIISDASFFSGAMDELKDEYQMAAYDRRGYGRDEQTGLTDFTVGSQAEDAATVLKGSFSEPAWIFGNSAGGLIAIELYLRHPELVRGLILLEPSLCYDDESNEILSDWNRELNEYVKAGRIKKAMPAFSRVIGQSADSGQTSLAEMKQTYKNLSNFMYGELNEVQNYRPEIQRLKDISVPVRVIVTKDGKDSIFAVSSKNGAELLGWQTAVFPGRHNMVKDRPEEFAAHFRVLLEEMRNGG